MLQLLCCCFARVREEVAVRVEGDLDARVAGLFFALAVVRYARGYGNCDPCAIADHKDAVRRILERIAGLVAAERETALG